MFPMSTLSRQFRVPWYLMRMVNWCKRLTRGSHTRKTLFRWLHSLSSKRSNRRNQSRDKRLITLLGRSLLDRLSLLDEAKWLLTYWLRSRFLWLMLRFLSPEGNTPLFRKVVSPSGLCMKSALNRGLTATADAMPPFGLRKRNIKTHASSYNRPLASNQNPGALVDIASRAFAES